MQFSLESKSQATTFDLKSRVAWSRTYCAMLSERDSFAKGIFPFFAKGFLLHKLLLKVNYSPLMVKKIPLT
jgi:hypothetical protein